MSLQNGLKLVHESLLRVHVDHALIGGMALSVLGYPRATNDIDFLVDGNSRAAAEEVMVSQGFTILHTSDEVAQWSGVVPVDFLYARRPLSQKMLQRAKQNLFLGIPVLEATDIIGLKIQAYSNNPKRMLQDLADIQKIIEVNKIDWERAKEYADAFQEWDRIKTLRSE